MPATKDLGRTVETRWFRLVGGLCLFICANTFADATLPLSLLRDERYSKLETFLRSYGCPQPHYTWDYLRAADKNALDYRLLPAISVRESTCGIHSAGNNYWGWASARRGFKSVNA